MKAPRSVVHAGGGAREFVSVAIRIAPATGGKDGFFVQVFPDMRPPQAVYVTIAQLERLLALAESSASEAEVWGELAKVPLEPLAPARSLYPRLRTLLVECAAPLREEIGTQRAAAEARSRPPENVEPPVSSAASEAAEASMGHAAGAPLRDPEVL